VAVLKRHSEKEEGDQCLRHEEAITHQCQLRPIPNSITPIGTPLQIQKPSHNGPRIQLMVHQPERYYCTVCWEEYPERGSDPS
jgi:hypothetical protein